jgi:hypothetical protein
MQENTMSSERPPEFYALYQARYGRTYSSHPADYSRCCKAVYDSDTRASWQCRRPNGHGAHGAYCKQHDPEIVAKKSTDRMAEWQAKWAANKRDAEFTRAARQAIHDIAAGHNDPRGLAQSILDAFNSTPTKGD